MSDTGGEPNADPDEATTNSVETDDTTAEDSMDDSSVEDDVTEDDQTTTEEQHGTSETAEDKPADGGDGPADGGDGPADGGDGPADGSHGPADGSHGPADDGETGEMTAANAEPIGEVDADQLIERVADHDAELAEEVEQLRDRAQLRGDQITELESELSDERERIEQLQSKLARTKADFENYKDRAKRKREQIRERATEDLVERLTEVRNNLVRALDQEDDADIRPGVESTLETFDRVLGEEGVEPIEPEPGEEVDPTRHRVMMRVESDQPAGTIASVYQPGYEMGGSVIEEAQVTVSEES